MARRVLSELRPLSVVRCPLTGQPRTTDHGPRTNTGFTLVEMLIAMAITLIMIGAVVTLFANISNSVRNRRAVVEVSGQLRHARNMLQQDLQGATCPGLPWQRPEDNVGYIEIIEGPYREGNASALLDSTAPPERQIDRTTSLLPTSNVPRTNTNEHTDGAGLGDYDDFLMLTVRNEHEPFVGRVPARVRIDETTAAPFDVEVNSNPNIDRWTSETIESPLAEVIWYAVENPADDQDPDNFFGEPGLRTIYRRTLLIAPWVNPYRFTDSSGNHHDTFRIDGSDTFRAKPGLVRIMVNNTTQVQALAALVAFQEQYDLSVRLEWDPLLGSNGRWKLVANTLGDLTKRENRYEHHFYRPTSTPPNREYPFAAISVGHGYAGNNVTAIIDREASGASQFRAARANLVSVGTTNGIVRDYTIEPDNLTDNNRRLPVRPFVFVDDNSTTLATARAMLNDDGEIVRVVHGPVPLSRQRRGEDVMLSDVLAFDLRVYDPGAPLFQHVPTDTVIDPTDPAWRGWPPNVIGAYMYSDNMRPAGDGRVGNVTGSSATFRFVGQGSYVDLGYGFDARGDDFSPSRPMQLPSPVYAPAFSSAIDPWFFQARALSHVNGNQLAPGYSVYDTWSFHYENNGVDEDGDSRVDQGTNGLDDPGLYLDASGAYVSDTRLGPDDIGERETRPPYDRPLRGAQAVIRIYERDSRQIRQVTVNQNFVPE